MTDTSNTAFHFMQADSVHSPNDIYWRTDRWLAPISMFDLKDGFDEQVWLDNAPANVLAMRLGGAPVTCRWGRHAGATTQKASVTFQPRGAPNHFSAFGRIRFVQLYLSDTLINRVAREIWSSEDAQGRLRDDLIFLRDDELERLYFDYVSAAIAQRSLLELEARAILIILHLLRVHHDAAPARAMAGGLAPLQLKRVCEAMEAHLGEDITLATLAQIAGVSATHFSRAFKQSTGVSPFTWLLRRRIARAREMLLESELSLAEIALATGFAAQPHFTTAFRREMGVTPGAWRRSRQI